jgi:hypothetical protein
MVPVLRLQVAGNAARLPKHSMSECPDGLSKGIRLLGVGHMAAIAELDEFGRGHRRCDDLRCAVQERIAVQPCDSKNRKPDTSEIIRGDDEGRLAEIGNEHRPALPVWLLGGLIQETPQARTDDLEEGIDCPWQIPGVQVRLNRRDDPAHELLAPPRVEGEHRRLRQRSASKQFRIAQHHVQADPRTAARTHADDRCKPEGPDQGGEVITVQRHAMGASPSLLAP